MALFLVQHGQCLSKTEDPEQPLSPEVTAAVARIAAVAEGYGVRPSVIEHSVKTRARQTAEILAGALRPPAGIRERTGLKPMDDIRTITERSRSEDHRMLVGHLPFMEKLTAYLTAGTTERTVIKFQNGGIVCLDHNPGLDAWFIKWALMPEII